MGYLESWNHGDGSHDSINTGIKGKHGDGSTALEAVEPSPCFPMLPHVFTHFKTRLFQQEQAVLTFNKIRLTMLVRFGSISHKGVRRKWESLMEKSLLIV
ncbi:hypothetical protein [Neobacillus cucumis]|uniref:hypothetical protein n=1 Tax=Neobacillus cucumis TaxID=1740721 RepID=UPI002E24D43D|nr:hypothetical protein [Neobacillus cucumis]